MAQRRCGWCVPGSNLHISQSFAGAPACSRLIAFASPQPVTDRRSAGQERRAPVPGRSKVAAVVGLRWGRNAQAVGRCCGRGRPRSSLLGFCADYEISGLILFMVELSLKYPGWCSIRC